MTAKLDSIDNTPVLSATLIAQLAAGLEPQSLNASQRAALKQRVKRTGNFGGAFHRVGPDCDLRDVHLP